MKLVISLSIVMLCFQCTNVFLRPLQTSLPEQTDCSTPPVHSQLRSFIEDSLYRHNAKFTKLLRLNSNYGYADKFVRLYKIKEDSTFSYILLFHFMDRYDYDLLKGPMLLKGDSKSFEKTVNCDPASVAMSHVIDQYYYVRLTEAEAHELSFSQSMTGQIGPIGFELPHSCREAWRSFVAPP